jgi:hypothetical protein
MRDDDLISPIGYDTFTRCKKKERRRRKSLISKGGDEEFPKG